MHSRTLLRLHVWLVASVLPLLVRLIPLPALLRLLTPPAIFRPYRGMSSQAIAEAVNSRLAKPVNMKRRACLRRGLTLFHFLKLAGLAATLHVAVYPPVNDPERMHAHCWVILDGKDISDPPEQPYATMMVHGKGGQT